MMSLRIKAIFDAADEHRSGSGDLTIRVQDDFGPMYTEVFMDGTANPIGVGGTPDQAIAMALEWAEGKRKPWNPLDEITDDQRRFFEEEH